MDWGTPRACDTAVIEQMRGTFPASHKGWIISWILVRRPLPFTVNLWREGELEDYELLDVRRVGDREEESFRTQAVSQQSGRMISQKKTGWEMSSDLYFEGGRAVESERRFQIPIR